MIPDHIIETAMDAYVENFPGTRCMRINMEAALEAVAADIWDDAYRTGVDDAWTSMDFDGGKTGANRNNPYRIEHT